VTQSVEELRRQLREAEALEAQAREERRRQTPVRYQYFIALASRRNSFDRLYDDTIVQYHIERVILNKAEAEAAGHQDWELRADGINYLFNKGTGKIICTLGGGTSYISERWNGENDGADVEAFEAISQFLDEHPNGGDITPIVETFQASRRNNEEGK